MQTAAETRTDNHPSAQSVRALDSLNLFVGDVLGGIGPYLAAYLRSARHWDPSATGAVLSAFGLASIIAQTPAGLLIDRLRQKRLLLCLSALMMALSCLAITIFDGFKAVLASQIIYGIGAVIAGPCIVAISLGLVGHQAFAPRVARNEAFNHVGNVIAAILAGALGALISPQWTFYVIAIFAVLTILSTLFIKSGEIDHDIARGADVDSDASSKPTPGMLEILGDRRVLAFIVAVTIFHLANAALLPLAGQYLSEGHPKEAPIWISACIIAAQIVMIPVAIITGKLAQVWGRKPVFLIGFLVLPVRALLFTLGNSPILVVSVQLLDGVGAGIFGVLVSVIVADLTQGTGRYNLTRSLVMTAQGLGAALSNLLAGVIVHHAGYVSGFVSMAIIGCIGLLICYFGLPETAPGKLVAHSGG